MISRWPARCPGSRGGGAARPPLHCSWRAFDPADGAPPARTIMPDVARTYVSLRREGGDAADFQRTVAALHSKNFLEAMRPCPADLDGVLHPRSAEALTPQHIKNLYTYGHAGEDTWANARWGTKWAEVLRVVEDGDSAVMATIDCAWCAPRPILRMLVAFGFTVSALTVAESLEWHEYFAGSGDPDRRRTSDDIMSDELMSRRRKTTCETIREDITTLSDVDTLLAASPLSAGELNALSVRTELEDRVKRVGEA